MVHKTTIVQILTDLTAEIPSYTFHREAEAQMVIKTIFFSNKTRSVITRLFENLPVP